MVKYIAEKEAKEQAKVKKVNFRDKVLGWKLFSMTTIMDDSKKHSQTLKDDLFMRVFLGDICLRPSCHDCHYAKFPRIADITLGDYWGIQTIHPEFDDDKGASLVLINSKSGQSAWDKIQSQITAIPSNLETAIKHNPSVHKSPLPHKNRTQFFAALDASSLSKLASTYCPKASIWRRVLRKLKRVIKS